MDTANGKLNKILVSLITIELIIEIINWRILIMLERWIDFMVIGERTGEPS